MTFIENNDGNWLREETQLKNIVEDIADVIWEIPSPAVITESANNTVVSFQSLKESNALLVEEALSREVLRSLTSNEVCQLCCLFVTRCMPIKPQERVRNGV